MRARDVFQVVMQMQCMCRASGLICNINMSPQSHPAPLVWVWSPPNTQDTNTTSRTLPRVAPQQQNCINEPRHCPSKCSEAEEATPRPVPTLRASKPGTTLIASLSWREFPHFPAAFVLVLLSQVESNTWDGRRQWLSTSLA